MSLPPPHLSEGEGGGDPAVWLRASPELKEDASSFQRAHPVRSRLLRRLRLLAMTVFILCHREPAESGRGDPAVWLRASPEIATVAQRRPRNDKKGIASLRLAMTVVGKCGSYQ